ncbi:folate-binding protein YgfZ, partial [bacterium]|nr:folate-binding protein YgfZ [bacterium]
SGTIEQFTFAERQQLSSPSSNECIWIFLGSGQDLPGREALSGSLILEHGSRDFGLVWFSVWGESELLRSWQLKYFAEAQLWDWSELDRRRISQVRPWVDHEMTSEVMPLELGLYDGIAEGKGCYPGQEVIERVISQGAPPRRLVLVAATGAGASGEVSSTLSASSWIGDQGLVLVRKNMASVGERLSILEHGEVTVVACSVGSPGSSS